MADAPVLLEKSLRYFKNLGARCDLNLATGQLFDLRFRLFDFVNRGMEIDPDVAADIDKLVADTKQIQCDVDAVCKTILTQARAMSRRSKTNSGK